MSDPVLIRPHWPAPGNVKACITTRQGGVCAKPYDSFNLALHVGDVEDRVMINRQNLMNVLGVDDIQWLEQVHGTKVVESRADGRVRTADACYTLQSGVACCVLTADCLPILLCDSSGAQVAAVHAGWRGLAQGIVGEVVEAFQCPPNQLLAYLGPAISVKAFEVGIDVLEAFFTAARNEAHLQAISESFQPSAVAAMKYQADIYALARAELMALGVAGIHGGDACTYTDSEQYYSFRRDGVTGRMASLIWLE